MSQSKQISNLSPEKRVLILDLLQSKQDPSYFINNHCWISHPMKGRIRFDTYEFQDEALKYFEDHRFNIVLKSRQMGISTLIAAYSLQKTQFNENKKILVIATKQEVARNIIEHYKFMYNNLDEHLKCPTTEMNKLTVRHTNGSFIKATSSSGDAGRSEAISLLIIDEAAFIANIDEIWTSAQATISTGGRVIILSCVVGDTYIFTDKGPVQIKSFIQPDKIGGYEIPEYNIYGKNKLRSGNLFHNNGKVKTRKIYTKYQDLEGSRNHKLYAYSTKNKKFDWYRLDQLVEGDYISIQKNMEQWGSNDSLDEYLSNLDESNKVKSKNTLNKITPELAYFLGLYISEGSCHKVKNDKNQLIGGSITLTCGDDLSNVFKSLNFTYHLDKDNLRYTVSSKSLIELMEHLGFDLDAKAPDKVIPDRLFGMSRENIIQLIRGIMDGDGCSYKKQISIRVRSKKLIAQLRILLLNFGILSTTFKFFEDDLNKYESLKSKFTGNCYSLEIYGRNVKTYYDKIGFNLVRKMDNKKYIEQCNFNRANTTDVIPNSIEMYNEMFNQINLPQNYLKIEKGIHTAPLNKTVKWRTDNLSRQTVLKMYNMFKDKLSDDFISKWDKIVDEDLIWCKIDRIKESENYTYDFSLPDNPDDEFCHSVLYNGIVGHQTPNGQGGFFHKTCMGAMEGTNGFNLINIPWYRHPDRDQKWRDLQTVQLGEKKAAQECVDGTTNVTIYDREEDKIKVVSITELQDMMKNA